MAVNLVYAYPDQLFRDTLVGIVDEILDPNVSSQHPTRGGYQEAIQIVRGSVNANDRTRALELFRSGFLRGRFIPAQTDSATTIPFGWSLAIQGEPSLTHLGYSAYAIGKAIAQSCTDPDLSKGLSAVVALSLITQHVEIDNVSISLAYAFQRAYKNWARPPGIDPEDWRRFLASAVFCTLNDDSRGRDLVQEFVSSGLIGHLAIKPAQGALEWLDQSQFETRIGSLDSTNDLARPKDSLFWLGSAADHRGWYSIAQSQSEDFLEAAYQIEHDAITSGSPNPFRADAFSSPGGGRLCPTEVIGAEFTKHPTSASIWESTMDHIAKGIRSALACVGELVIEEQRPMYAHGVQNEIPDGDFDISVPAASVDEMPGAAIKINLAGKVVSVASVETVGDSLLIHLESQE